MFMNVSGSPTEQIAALFGSLSNPGRLQILLVIGRGQACVCHMRAALGLRQAYLSQQLMALRRAGILTTTREGRHIYYRCTDPALLDLVEAAARQLGVELPAYPVESLPGCEYKKDSGS